MIDFAFSGKFWHKRTSQPIALCRVAESAEEYGQTEQLQSPKRYSGTSSYEKMSYRSTCDTFVRTQAEAGNRSSKSQSKSDKINVSEMIVREVQQFLRNQSKIKSEYKQRTNQMKAIVLNFFATMREELCGILAAKEQQLLEGIDSEYVEVLKTMQSIKSEVKMIYGNKQKGTEGGSKKKTGKQNASAFYTDPAQSGTQNQGVIAILQQTTNHMAQFNSFYVSHYGRMEGVGRAIKEVQTFKENSVLKQAQIQDSLRKMRTQLIVVLKAVANEQRKSKNQQRYSVSPRYYGTDK